MIDRKVFREAFTSVCDSEDTVQKIKKMTAQEQKLCSADMEQDLAWNIQEDGRKS